MKREEAIYGAADIGGTKIAVGLLSENQLLCCRTFPTEAVKGIHQAAEGIRGALDELRGDRPLSGIGVGSAGPIDPVTGIYGDAYSLPGWQNHNMMQILEKLCDVPVAVDNDVNAALLGERVLSGLQGQDVLLVMCGTGVGISLWEGGSLYRTRLPHHPEMGHLQVVPDGPKCVCGRRGCIESVLSGTALNARAAERRYRNFDDAMRSAHEYKEADAFATAVRAAFRVGVWNLALLFQPHVLLLGGGIMKAHFDFFRRCVEQDMPWNSSFAAPFKVLPLSHDEAPLVGAASLAAMKQEGGQSR